MKHNVAIRYRETHYLAASEASFVKKNNQEIVLFCGSPGAGKSTFYFKHLQPLGFQRINQDILKTVSCASSQNPVEFE